MPALLPLLPSRLHLSPRGLRRLLPLALLGTTLASGACATFQQLVALRQVDFALDALTRVELAGVDVTEVRGVGDLSLSEGLRIADQVRAGTLPLALTLRVLADNPSSNGDARLVRMDWTLFLEDRETVSGRFADELVLPSGASTPFPLSTELDLLEFFDGGADELFALVRSAAGLEDEPPSLALEVLPVVRTALGAIPYDRPIRIDLTD